MKRFCISTILIFVASFSFAQKSYLVHLTIDKIYLGKDSVIFKNGKTFLLEMKNHSDTLEVAKLGGIPVAIVIDVRRAKVGERIKYQIGYSFYKKENSKWTIIRNFGFIDRYELNSATPEFEASAKKKSAHEEYHCSIGEPQQFAAFFRMDVYKKGVVAGGK
jgi:hypothetical protein